jgi:hypothetical protein
MRVSAIFEDQVFSAIPGFFRNYLIMKAESKKKKIDVKGDHIVLNVMYEYNIPLNRCRSYPEILGWSLHLSEKTWMTTKLIREFIHVALQANKLGRPSP